jgi:hypothetical protein
MTQKLNIGKGNTQTLLTSSLKFPLGTFGQWGALLSGGTVYLLERLYIIFATGTVVQLILVLKYPAKKLGTRYRSIYIRFRPRKKRC